MNPFAGLIEGIALSNVYVKMNSETRNINRHNLLSSPRLYGIAISQAYVYMQNCRLDPKWMKLMVIFVMYLDRKLLLQHTVD